MKIAIYTAINRFGTEYIYFIWKYIVDVAITLFSSLFAVTM